MTIDQLELVDFHVTDVKSHVSTASAQELALSAKNSVSARTADPYDGLLYLFMNVVVTAQTEELFSLDISTETVMRLPDYKKEVTEEDAPPCIALARRETNRAVRELTKAMGIAELDLDTAVN